jgi:hypothetical protein
MTNSNSSSLWLLRGGLDMYRRLHLWSSFSFWSSFGLWGLYILLIPVIRRVGSISWVWSRVWSIIWSGRPKSLA